MSKIFKICGGREINVIMKDIKGAQVINESTVIQGNVVIEGYLLDEDDIFYYLGTTNEDIDEALLKSNVMRIYLPTDERSEFEIEINNDGDMH